MNPTRLYKRYTDRDDLRPLGALYGVALCLLFMLGFAFGLGPQMPPSKRDREPATLGYVSDQIARLQEQIDETRRVAWSEARIKKRLDDLEARAGKIERQVNELEMAVKALGKDW